MVTIGTCWRNNFLPISKLFKINKCDFLKVLKLFIFVSVHISNRKQAVSNAYSQFVANFQF